MKKASLLALLVLLAPALAQAGAGDLGPGSASLPVNIVSTFSATNPGYVVALTGTSNIGTVTGSTVAAKIQDGSGTGVDSFAVFSATGLYVTTAPREWELSNSKRMFSIATNNLNAASSGADNPALFMENRSTSTKTVYIYSLNVNVAATTDIKLFVNPTITTAGTLVLSTSTYLGSSVVSNIKFFSLPTVSVTGSQFQRVKVTAQAGGSSILPPFLYILAPGNSILITSNPAANNTVADYEMIWAERP